MQLLLTLLPIVVSALALDWRIIFPKDNNYESGCTLDDGAKGDCRNIKNCPTAIFSKNKPKHCYFEKSEQFVCCTDQSSVDRIKSTLTQPPITEKAPTNRVRVSNGRAVTERISTIVCENNYPLNTVFTKHVPTNLKQFPYMIALGYDSMQPNVFEYKCGGALISKDFMLAAAHCAKLDDNLEPVIALRGGEHLNDRSAIIHRIAEVYIHPDYNSTLAYNDIALIKLEKPININYNSQEFACIWNSLELPEKRVTALSYGKKDFNGNSNQLLEDNLLAISNEKCNEYYHQKYPIFLNGIVNTQMCAENTKVNSDSCQGDFGGPLVMRAAVNHSNGMANTLFTRPYIVGITSFSQGCDEQPGVFTRVSAHIDWIENIVWPRKAEKIKQSPYY